MKSLLVGVGLPIVAAVVGTTVVLGSVGLVPGMPIWTPLYEAAVNAKTVNPLPTATPTPLPTATPEPPTRAPTRVPPTPQPTATPRSAPMPPTPWRAPPPTAKPRMPPPAPTQKPPADSGLKSMALQLSDLIPGFALTRSEPLVGEPEGYQVSFERGGLESLVGTASVDNRVWRYRSAEDACATLTSFTTTSEAAQPTSIPTIGEQSQAWTTRSDEKGTVSYLVVVRKGALIATISTAGSTSASFDDTVRYAKLVAERLR